MVVGERNPRKYNLVSERKYKLVSERKYNLASERKYKLVSEGKYSAEVVSCQEPAPHPYFLLSSLLIEILSQLALAVFNRCVQYLFSWEL